jgi:hypothetical protein
MQYETRRASVPVEERNIKRVTQTAPRNGTRATAGGRELPEALRLWQMSWCAGRAVSSNSSVNSDPISYTPSRRAEISCQIVAGNRPAATPTKDDSPLSSTERREMVFPSASGFRRAARPSQRLHRFQPAALGRPSEGPTGDWFHYPCTECQGSSDEIPHLIRSLSGPIPGRRWHFLRLVGDQGRKRKK